ncbi:hypothetical protein GCM10011505_27730 [Tistrella bauzanensis]|uniref:FecR N-terminal domain-containing protein n=1 Tax=Tistrella bauzanensis TaxID=657419 RepID=A0ABQ1IKN8_9PROT|nr:DUF4880 domain-containing protein [Tistrella bauzanensis]GGB44885.1 hypothetical protein GCM10011505_27730 [Tistrella bauzanensis]
MTAGSAPRPSAALIAEAADWLIRRQAAPDDQALDQASMAWLSADPAHAMAFEEVRRNWLAVPQGLGAVEMPRMPAAAARPRQGRRLAWGLAGMAVAAGLVLALTPGLAVRMTADAATGIGEVRLVTLADGSLMRLAPLSAADLRFDGDRRRVVL